MRNVFITYHHANDQYYKEWIVLMNLQYRIFNDCSVNTGDIDETLDNHTIRQKIRDEYLRNSTVTLLLLGTETKKRKHIDWEIYSSMIDGRVNKRSGVLVITLPTTRCHYFEASHSREKEVVYPDQTNWISITTRQEYERRYPYLPDRIIDNLLNPGAKISVVPWERIFNTPQILDYLIDVTSVERLNCRYDLSRPMKHHNS